MTGLQRSVPDSRIQIRHLVDLLGRVSRHWLLIAIMALTGAAMGLGVGILSGRKYSSETVIIHRELIPSKLLQGGDAVVGSLDLEIRFRDMAQSSQLLGRLVEQYGLLTDVVASRGMTAAIEEMKQRVRLRAKGGGTFHLSYLGDSPQLAQKVTADLASSLIGQEIEFRRKAIAATREFLDGERSSATAELQDRELALAEFQAKHPEFAADAANGTGAAGASIRARSASARAAPPAPLPPAVVALRRRHARLVALLAHSRSPRPSGAKQVERSQAQARVEQIRQGLFDQQERLATLLGSYTHEHPDVQAQNAAIERTKARLKRAETMLAEANLATAAKPATQHEIARLETELREVEQAIAARQAHSQLSGQGRDVEARIVGLETEWAKLKREVEEAAEHVEAIESRTFAAELVAASEVGSGGAQIEILDPASRPYRPTGMPRRLMAMAGFMVMAAVGIAISLVLALLDDRIVTVEDLEGESHSVFEIPPLSKKDSP